MFVQKNIRPSEDQPLSGSARMVDRAMQPVLVARTGRNPLEFIGRCLARNIGTPPLGIELWLRQAGDLVVVHPGDAADRTVVEAVVVADIAAARQHLEAACSAMGQLPTVVDIAQHHPNLNLAEAVGLLHKHRALVIEVSDLVMDALADWDVLCSAEA